MKAFGATNEERTCLWCGDKLRRTSERTRRAFKWPEDTFGDYGDNMFCTLRCGYKFGVESAKADVRFSQEP